MFMNMFQDMKNIIKLANIENKNYFYISQQ